MFWSHRKLIWPAATKSNCRHLAIPPGMIRLQIAVVHVPFRMEGNAMRYRFTMAIAAGAMLCSAGDQAKADAGGLSSTSAIDRPHRGRLCGKRREIARTARQAVSSKASRELQQQPNDGRPKHGPNQRCQSKNWHEREKRMSPCRPPVIAAGKDPGVPRRIQRPSVNRLRCVQLKKLHCAKIPARNSRRPIATCSQRICKSDATPTT
jgi:hypothetical protein